MQGEPDVVDVAGEGADDRREVVLVLVRVMEEPRQPVRVRVRRLSVGRDHRDVEAGRFEALVRRERLLGEVAGRVRGSVRERHFARAGNEVGDAAHAGPPWFVSLPAPQPACIAGLPFSRPGSRITLVTGADISRAVSRADDAGLDDGLYRTTTKDGSAVVPTGSAEPLPLGRHAPLRGRASELTALARLVEAVLAGQSRVLVIRGEPGAGKTALLDYLAGQAPGCRVVRALGVQSEMELAFAGLHQLCVPMLARLDGLPEPQREALRTAFGLSAGPAPDRFLVGLAVLSLLSEEAGEQPLLCLVDDYQWLGSASAPALGFVAARGAGATCALVLAARDPVAELAGLPGLTVDGLPDGDARALLDSALAGPLDARVRDQIVAETRGNPLALLELPRGLGPAELA